MTLTKKVALITGASSGLGAATAKLFAERGALLSLTGRNSDNLQATRNACVQGGAASDQILLLCGDVTDEEFRKKLVEQTVDEFGGLDILVNCAGVVKRGGMTDPDLFANYDVMMEANVKAVVRLTQFCVPHLRKTKGNIVNISSVAGVTASRSNGFYNMSKAALDSFTKSLSLELAADNIRVNSVNPGAVTTPIFHLEDMPDKEREDFVRRMGKGHALGRMGVPSEVAEAVAFLASDAASFTTGHLLMVDGGRHLLIPRPEDFVSELK